ncbi:hypothetical protein JK206_01205 [Gluconobacter cerinus]|nr:hypothetical protein [Gluconobacter cerinus]
MLLEPEFRQICLRFLILPDMTPAFPQVTYKKGITGKGYRCETTVVGMQYAPARKLRIACTVRYVRNC